MEQHGFEKLGSGFNAMVFQHIKRKYVVKVFDGSDTGYRIWYSFMIKNQKNKYVPKIIGRIVPISDRLFAVRMEKLKEADLTRASSFTAILKHYIFSDEKRNDPDLQDVVSFLKQYDNMLDVSIYNVMSRGNQIVVIDPLF